MRSNQLCGHLWFIHAYANAVACHPWLGNLEQRGANPITVADAHCSVRQTVNGEVFSKLSIREIATAKFALPVLVGIQLIDHHGTIHTTMPSHISLAIPV